MAKKIEYFVSRKYEDENRIIYKREYNLQNCGGDLRYFDFDKKTDKATGKQFKSITQVNKYLKSLDK